MVLLLLFIITEVIFINFITKITIIMHVIMHSDIVCLFLLAFGVIIDFR